MNGFLIRLLAFVDTNSAFLLGSNPYLQEFSLTGMPHHQPFQPDRFDTIAQSRSLRQGEQVASLEHFIGFVGRRNAGSQAGTDSGS